MQAEDAAAQAEDDAQLRGPLVSKFACPVQKSCHTCSTAGLTVIGPTGESPSSAEAIVSNLEDMRGLY
jgi:hypothetical protein